MVEKLLPVPRAELLVSSREDQVEQIGERVSGLDRLVVDGYDGKATILKAEISRYVC